jgi:hypothetical protein
MSQAYPISIARFTALLEALEPMSDQISTLRKFLTNRIPSGFPVKLGERTTKNYRSLNSLKLDMTAYAHGLHFSIFSVSQFSPALSPPPR